ncbi:hypothetical protein GCM10009611_11600 [Arthrobacter roseus]
MPKWIEVYDETSMARFDINSRVGVWREQQLIKMMFGVQGRFKNFLVLDSDSYFIRPFTEPELFCAGEGISLTVTENDYLFRASHQFAVELANERRHKSSHLRLDAIQFKSNSHFEIERSLVRDASHAARRPSEVSDLIGDAFGRIDSNQLYFLPTPISWSSEVLQDMWTTLNNEGITFSDLLRYSPWEAIWYGHWAIQRFRERVVPKEPDFLHFSSDSEIDRAKELGITEKSMSGAFMGVTLAARHQEKVQFGSP